jgi:hypothetical protein
MYNADNNYDLPRDVLSKDTLSWLIRQKWCIVQLKKHASTFFKNNPNGSIKVYIIKDEGEFIEWIKKLSL